MLSPGGYLFIDTPTRESFYYRLGELSYGLSGGRQPLFLRSMYCPAPYAHKQIFTQQQLTALLEGMGMNVRQLESFHELSFPYSFYLRKLVKSQKLADMLAPLASAFFVVFRIRNKMLVVARKDEHGAKSGRL
jgi:2-polyprenyl-6-hydroxyphenyl methylase/3-demethylubiquinone-9 3-methyltransferase